MTDSFPGLVPVLVALAVVGATTFALSRRERRRVERSSLDLSPLRSGVTLFSDTGCGRCDEARQVLVDEEIEFEEFRFDHHRDVHEAVGVTGVPLVVVKADDGSEVGRIAGRVEPARLRRLVSAANR